MYIRAVVRDVKQYLKRHARRPIPVGYSAADDLRYRIPLAKYLECGDETSAVDFYGVNSYQWCGEQSFLTSGYDILLNDYDDFTKPLMMSEYGCNVIKPRIFQEVAALYSSNMSLVFSGGLVYEFTQGPNDYGLVELDGAGNAFLNSEFDILREKFAEIPETEPALPIISISRPRCDPGYPNINSDLRVPDSFGTDMISHGIFSRPGSLIDIGVANITIKQKIVDSSGKEIVNKVIVPRVDQIPYDILRQRTKHVNRVKTTQIPSPTEDTASTPDEQVQATRGAPTYQEGKSVVSSGSHIFITASLSIVWMALSVSIIV
jgi:hypothetical protein